MVLALGSFVICVGLIRAIVGAFAWFTVRSQLAAERIRIPDSAERMAGRPVRGPLSAFQEAEVVKKIALAGTGGRMYGEMDESDPKAHMAMEASLIRSSLFTSILAFAISAAEVVLGASLVAIGVALLRMDRLTRE